MKKILMFSLVVSAILANEKSFAQEDKSKRPSPPDKVSVTTTSGNTITIDYSKPSVKGRAIGKDLAPYGKVWRTGANEATTFEITKDAKVQGKPLPKGKYSLYTIPTEKTWTIIFNKTWKQWGTVYNEAEDALRVTADAGKSSQFTEQMTFQVAKDGKVTLMWGNTELGFMVK